MDVLTEIFHNKTLQNITGILFIIAGSIILYLILNFILKKFGTSITAKTKTEIDDKILEFVTKFLNRIILVIALLLIGEYLSRFISKELIRYFQELLFVVVVFITTTLTIKFLSLITDWYLKKTAERTQTEIDREFGPLLHRLVQIILFVTGILVVLDHFNIDAKGLVATLGVGSLAIAFAAQDTLANMIAGFVIMFDRPFRVGDRIKTPNGTIGEVYEIGLRSMKILDFEKNLHIIPNQEIVKAPVINYSYPQPLVRVKIEVGVAYGSDLDKAKQIIIDTYKNHPKILNDPQPNAFFINFGDSSLDLIGIGYVAHYSEAWLTGEQIRMQVYKAFNQHKIEIPFPQRVVWIQQQNNSEKKD